MAEKRFSELTTAGAMTGAELLAMSQETLGTLLSVKSTLQNIANWFAVNSQYASALDTTDKTLCGAINELKQLISLIPQFSIEVVQTLPVSDISETTIYLVPNSDPEQGNYYEEYIYVNNTWELVGTTAVDLSAYYTKLEVDGLLAAKANTSDVTAALALKEAKSDLDDDVTDIVVGLTDEQTTAPGNPVTLTTVQEGGAKSALVTFAPKQSGTGDPSPSNIRPISGWDSLHVYVDEEQSASPANTYTATFPDIVYGGSYDFVSGEGVNPWCAVKVDLGSLNYTYSSSGQGTFRSSDLETVVLKPASNDDKSGIMCECYTVQTANDVYRGVDGIGITSGGKLWIHDTRTTDPDAFKSLVNGLYLIYPLTTPTPISLTPADVNLLKGSNTVWTDGDTVQIKYSELPNGNLGAVIDYIKKLEARVKTLES